MFKGNLPFDDRAKESANKTIPSSYGAFIEFVDYLATSPNVDANFVGDSILQFLTLPKLKPEQRSAIFFALSSIELSEDFWLRLFAQYKTQFTPKWEHACDMITAMKSAPVSAIIKEFPHFLHLNQFLSHPNLDVKFAVFATLYKFRDHLTVSEIIVDEIIKNINSKSPKLIFIVINWLMFLLSIDYPNIREHLGPYTHDLIDIIFVYGHLMNEKHLSFILDYSKPTLHQRISMVMHVSLASASFILSSLPSAPDYEVVSDISLTALLPLYIDLIRNPTSEGTRNELFIAALDVLKRSSSPTTYRPFFDTIVDMMFAIKNHTEFRLISLLADVAQMYSDLSVILAKAAIEASNQTFFTQFISVSCQIAIKKKTDIVRELLKMFTWHVHDSFWRLSTAAGLMYLWTMKEYTALHFQEIFNVAQSLSDTEVKTMLIVFLAHFVPINQRSPLVNEAKNCLFPHLFVPCHATYDLKKVVNRKQLPVTLRIILVRVITNLAQGDELEDVEDELKSPLFSSFTCSPLTKDTPPINPFIFCENAKVGALSAALEFPLHKSTFDFIGITRPFTRVSPESHALCVEIASIVTGKHKSMALDIRLSVKQLSPNIIVYFDIPPMFTPPHVTDWHITDLVSGSKVNRRITFTANKMSNPYIAIHADIDGQRVLDLKVCVPLLDMFDKIDPNGAVASHLWGKMRYEKTNVNLPDSMWVCWNGCVAVKNGTARADDPSFLNMLPSAFKTTAVIE